VAFQILALSGGGYLGLYSAAVLAELERQNGCRAVDMFDMIAGTSIGGIIALGLAIGRPASEIRDAFIEDGASIFGERPPPRSWLGKADRFASSFRRPGYSAAPLKATIERIVGLDTKMHDLKRPTVIPAVNLTKGGPKVFKTGHSERFVLDWRLPVVDVALATSAAPTYFPAHRIGDEIYADGGMFANSPDMIALHEAEQFLGIDRSELRILSIGTTTTCFAMSHRTDIAMGIWNWASDSRATNVIIGCQQALTNDMMRHVLGDRYVRIDRIQADAQRKELALDCASPTARADLLAMASASIAEAAGNDMLRTMLTHTASPFAFINASL
jgi:uncharacterized protein